MDTRKRRGSGSAVIDQAARCCVEALEARTLLAGLSIAAENQLPGVPASEWDIDNAGDPSIQGFATDISVNQGETVYFKIDDASRAPYRLDIYRMGYYGGMGARKVATINSSQTLRISQPDPLTDPATGLIDAGNWAVSASWNVPADATSGIYFAKVTREDTGGASHIYFIVRNDTDHSELIFQTSDTTWQAYNNWGGKALYDDISTDGRRAYKVSYNRPFSTRSQHSGYGSYNFVFHAEYPMVRWLEANGYDVSYTSGVDTARRGAELLEHKVFLSVGHDEYWSGDQRANVEAARAAGVNLAFFSGNEVFRKTRWESSIDSAGTDFRTLVCYKETNADEKIDPLPNVWTGTWRDPRFSPPADGGVPENALTGTIFTVALGPADLGTSLKVPAEDGKMRFWRNTSAASLGAGQTATFGTYVVGYEWNEDLDNGFRPAGLMRLSTTTASAGSRLLGENITTGKDVYGPGTSTHSMTFYRAPSGSLVFSAGSVQWSWGLDSEHDNGSYAADRNIQQATVNLFADMGVQPGTLRSGLIRASASTDFTRPTSTIASPGSGGTFQPGASITITGTAIDSGGGMVGGVEVSVDGGLTWHPAKGRGNWSYSWTPVQSGAVTIKSRAVDDSGNLEVVGAGVTITIGGQQNPSGTSIWSDAVIPQIASDSDGSAVELGVKFRSDVDGYIRGIRFYKGSQNTGTHIGNLWTRTGTLLARATFIDETASGWQSVLFSTPVAITANTTYVASYHTNVGHYSVNEGYFSASGADSGPLHALRNGIDGANGVYRYGGTSTFPTDSYMSSNYWVDVLFEAGTDTQAPTVISRSPSPNATGVSTATAVTATFSEAIQPATISFVLRDASNNLVSAALSYNSTTNTVTLTPNAALAAASTYTATLSGVQDLAGNPMAGPLSWSFSTLAVDTQPPSVTAQSPSPNATGVALTARLTATFNEAVQSGSVAFALSGPNGSSVPGTLSYDSGTRTASFTPDAPLASFSSYTASVRATDLAGNAMAAAFTWSFTTMASDTTAPSVTGRTPASDATGVAVNAPVTVTFSEDVQWNLASFELRDAANALVPASVSYNSTTRTATLTPSGALANSAIYTARVSGVVDLAGNAMSGPVTWSFTTVAAPSQNSFSLWSNTAIPAIVADPDTSAVELGVKFRSSVSGYVTGVRFYKSSSNTGTHIGNLWSSGGQRLATVTFIGETASGWQTAFFSPPVFIAANTTYVASYHTNTGRYSVNEAYFADTGVDNGPLHALQNGEEGPNGLYRYGSSSGFPTSSYMSSNYWVDVVFSPAADTDAPTVSGYSPTANATGVSPATSIAATFSEPIEPASIAFVLRDAGGNAIPASVVYSDANRTATLTPMAPLGGGATYTAIVQGARDLAGNNLASPVSWSFSTAGVWIQSSATDFAAGTIASLLVTNTAGGELQLAPTFSDEFDNGVVGPEWTSSTWSSGTGTATVTEANGLLSIGRTQVLSVQSFNNRAVEGRIAFAAARWQQFGLATDSITTLGNYSAIFTTKATTNTLYARVNVAGTIRDVSLGAIPTGFHTYRIQPISTGFQFYVDGVLRTTVSRTIPANVQLKAALAAQNGTPVLQAEWIRALSYSSMGTFVSSVLDAGRSVAWQSVAWNADLPAGTSVVVEISTGDSADPTDGTWSVWSPVGNGSAITGRASRYLRYRLQLTTGDATNTPTLFDVSVAWV